MIVYTLRCPDGHDFEGWFGNAAAFDAQAASGHVICPMCGSTKIEKAPMAPSLPSAVGEKTNAVERMAKMRQFVVGLRKHIEDNSEYVGADFPEEARKIHYGESEERAVYGEASIEEARSLIEEGIAVMPIPPDPGEAN
jgi:hypothetical protein